MAGALCERRVVICMVRKMKQGPDHERSCIALLRWLDCYPEAFERSLILLELTTEYDFFFFSEIRIP